MMKLVFLLLFISLEIPAQDDYGFLKKEDQKFFQNDALDGKNKWERIDANVREINRLHGDIAAMKLELQRLRVEVDELKKKK